MLNLRPYQLEAIQAFEKFTSNGGKRGIIVLPTGTGKTILGLSIAKKLNCRVLWLAHRDELITQPIEALNVVWPEVTSGIVKAELNDYNKQFVFASVQTAHRDNRLENLNNFDLVVVDEVHHCGADTYKKILENLGCLKENGPLVLGLTATPERGDQKKLDDIFEKIIYQFQLKEAIEKGYLVNVELIARPINVDLDNIKTIGGDLKLDELEAALLEGDIIKNVCDAMDEHAQGKKTIIFTVSVHQAKEIALELQRRNHKAEYISGDLKTEDRRQRLKDFSSGKILVMSSVGVLTEGFDEPTVDCILMARPTKSKSLFIQCVGRGLRIAPNKKSCTIIDMVAVSKRHNLIVAPAIFGLEPPEKSDQSQEKDGVKDSNRASILLSQIEGAGIFFRSALKWIASADGKSLALSCGQGGTLLIQKYENSKCSIVVVGRNNSGLREPLCDKPIDMELAQGIAEDYVRRANAVYLTNRSAKWRDGLATEKQINFLKKMKVEIKDGLTKGEASDLLTKFNAGSWRNEPATPKQKQALKYKGIQFDHKITKGEAGRLLNNGRV